MKASLITALMAAATVVAGAAAQPVLPPPVAPVPALATVAVLRDGPFRIYAGARVDARRRRADGYVADILKENGNWWVVFHR